MASRLLRSALYVPAANARALAKAGSLPADAIIIDLEDSVAPEAKDQACSALEATAAWRKARIVRVNAAETPWHLEDIAAAVRAEPQAMLLPKPSSGEDVWTFRQAVAACKPRAPIAVWAMIETAAGALNAAAIAAALGPGGALALGPNDLARETGMAQVAGRAPMLSVLTGTVLAARAHGASVLDGVFTAIGDAEGFAAECRQARDFGFDGKTLIHPGQIDPANAIFAPTPAEIAEAQAVVSAFSLPESAGKGVIALSGRMVERLHLEMAQDVLARAAAIAARG